MKKWILFSILAITFLLILPACQSVEAGEQSPTPENPFLEEELAAEAIATAIEKKTQIASRVLPYTEISDGEQTYLAFWFAWNDETVFLPIAESTMADSGLLSCQLDPETRIAIGELFSGWEFLQDECMVDKNALENAFPIIRIPGYFDDGVKIDHGNEADTGDWNVIDLNGEYARSFAEVVTIIVENDLLGSGDLFISIHRTDGPNSEHYGDAGVAPTYLLPKEKLLISFSSDQLEKFEYVDDVVLALEREFTWKIPAGYRDLNISPGDENWFVLRIREMKSGNTQEEEHLSVAYIQVKSVGTSESDEPDPDPDFDGFYPDSSLGLEYQTDICPDRW